MQFNRIIDPDFFTNEATRRIYGEIKSYYDKYSGPKVAHMDILSAIKVKEKDPEVVKECTSALVQMKRINSTVDLNMVKSIAVDWSKRNLVKQALYEGLDQLDRGNGLDLDPIRTRLDAAANLGIDEQEDYGYLAETRERLQHDSMLSPIEVGIPDMDEMLEGGLDVGELGLFIGPTHRGKTRALVNVGVHALRKGKHVAHIIIADSTAKRIARRYDSILCNRLYSSLQSDPNTLRRHLRNVHQAGGRLILKEYDKVAPTPNDIRHWVKSYTERQKRGLDLIIIDYLDEIHGTKSFREYRFESRDVTGAIRRLGAEFNCPVWSASQGNRKAFSKLIVDLDDVAEDISKVNQADVVITINQTEEEKQENIVRYRLSKARRERFAPKMFVLEVSEAGVIESPEWGQRQ